jgi:flagellar basal body-associated protein FliL
MNKKLIIQLIVIAFCFAAAGLVLYNGFFKNNLPAVSTQAVVSNLPNQQQQVLPYGNTLDFSQLNKFDQQYNSVSQPSLDTGQVGVPLQNLFAPAPTQ